MTKGSDPARASATGGADYCAYCVPELGVSDAFNEEHVLPAKLGGTVTIRTHVRCNSQAALAVDNPFMANPDVEMLRGLSGVRNTRRGGRPRGAQFRSEMHDGAVALLRAGPDGVEIEQVSAGAPQELDVGEYSFTLPVGTHEQVKARTAKILAKLQAENPGKTVTLSATEQRRGHVTVERSWGIRPDSWPRFAAKVALGILSLTMPPQWRGSDGELFLMALFRNGVLIGTGSDGISAVPRTLSDEPDNPMYRHLYPWEHSLTVLSRDGAVTVSMVLFGELRYDLGVRTELSPIGPCVWLCDYRESTPLTFDSVEQFALAVTERFVSFGEFAAMRHERPRSHLVGPVARARMRETLR